MRFIRLVAFVSGLVVLGIEITAFRIVAPFFGNSIYITTNILAVILAGLALGYWLGGWTADRVRAARPLFWLMMVTAGVCALIPFVAPWLLGVLREQLTAIDWRLVVFSLVGCVALFFVPFVMLGMVSPWLVRLAINRHERRGSSAGSIYAWSTLGSLLGTFLPTLLLVPLIGTKRTILALSALLALIALAGLTQRSWRGRGPALGSLLVIVITAASLLISPRFSSSAAVITERESAIEHLRVVSDGGAAVHLEQDEGLGVHSVYDPDRLETGLVFDWLSFTPELGARQDNLSVAIIGLAGGTVARQLEAYYGPNLSIVGVELDPATLQLGREFFGLDQRTTLTTVAADGRVWLSTQEDTFDIIIVDAFRQLYIPPHLSTQQFFELVKQRLAPDGVMAVNLNAVGQNSFVERTLATTIATVFDHVQAVKIPGSYNVVFYAGTQQFHIPDPADYGGSAREQIAQTVAAGVVPVQPDQSLQPATDDRPLVESWYDVMLGQAYLRE